MLKGLEALFAYENGSNSLGFVITAFVVGMIIASICMLYEIKVSGRIIRVLDRAGARSPETAIPAEAFGLSDGKLRRLLRPSTVISKYVKICEDGALTQKSLCYLDPAKADQAAIRYDRRRAHPRTVIIGAVLLAVLGIAMAFVIPDLVQMVKNFVSMVKK